MQQRSDAEASAGIGSRLVFLGGLHRSGTSLVHRCLSDHSLVSGFHDTGVPEDEGQHLQTVYPPAAAFGGSGRFGFRPESFMDETSPLATPANAQRLLEQWLRYWDASKPMLVEKSPPNLVRARFLQALFPGSRFIMVLRHPIAVAYATQKWTPDLKVHSLIEHWLLCHEQFERDRSSLEHVHVFHYEDFVRTPQEHLDAIYDFVGLPSEPVQQDVKPRVNDRYFDMWRKRRDSFFTRGYIRRHVERLEERVRRFGYSLEDFD